MPYRHYCSHPDNGTGRVSPRQMLPTTYALVHRLLRLSMEVVLGTSFFCNVLFPWSRILFLTVTVSKHRTSCQDCRWLYLLLSSQLDHG